MYQPLSSLKFRPTLAFTTFKGINKFFVFMYVMYAFCIFQLDIVMYHHII